LKKKCVYYVNVIEDPRELSCKVIKWNELAEDHVDSRFWF